TLLDPRSSMRERCTPWWHFNDLVRLYLEPLLTGTAIHRGSQCPWPRLPLAGCSTENATCSAMLETLMPTSSKAACVSTSIRALPGLASTRALFASLSNEHPDHHKALRKLLVVHIMSQPLEADDFAFRRFAGKGQRADQ